MQCQGGHDTISFQWTQDWISLHIQFTYNFCSYVGATAIWNQSQTSCSFIINICQYKFSYHPYHFKTQKSWAALFIFKFDLDYTTHTQNIVGTINLNTSEHTRDYWECFIRNAMHIQNNSKAPDLMVGAASSILVFHFNGNIQSKSNIVWQTYELSHHTVLTLCSLESYCPGNK